MALGNSAIATVEGAIVSISKNKDLIKSAGETISFVKNNNDLSMWADDTAIGSKWSQNVDQLIKQTDSALISSMDTLINQTNNFLNEQRRINASGQ